VLSAPHRLSASRDFSEVVRRGRRASRPLLTVHALLGSDAQPGPPRAGLVVSKAVGTSVVRSRTARRLRHLLRDRVPALPPGSRLVVRASGAAGSAPSSALAADLDAALSRLTRPSTGPSTGPGSGPAPAPPSGTPR
jgi:ribonuclease P protein component